MHPFAHFKTITRHRNLVCRYCFKVGLYRQGLTHDLSKYAPVEFWRGAKYYQGFRSPNDAERKETGVSMAWLHHKGRNKHHLEYWIDYCIAPDGSVYFGGNRMPIRYVAEMFCDRVAACKVYKGDAYTEKDPLAYQEKMRPHVFMHPETEKLITHMLTVLSLEGEDEVCRYIRYLLDKEKRS